MPQHPPGLSRLPDDRGRARAVPGGAQTEQVPVGCHLRLSTRRIRVKLVRVPGDRPPQGICASVRLRPSVGHTRSGLRRASPYEFMDCLDKGLLAVAPCKTPEPVRILELRREARQPGLIPASGSTTPRPSGSTQRWPLREPRRQGRRRRPPDGRGDYQAPKVQGTFGRTTGDRLIERSGQLK